MRKPQAGFTIVELLIVIVIIAILAAISIVAYSGIQTRARAAAHQSAAGQAEKLIMTNALLTSGESLSLGGTLIGYKEDAGDETLLRPITGTSDITIYSVLEVVGGNSVYSPYMLLTPHTYGTHAFTLDTGNAGETFMRSRVDTSLQVNWVVQSTPGYYVAGNTVICWLQMNHATAIESLGCNQAAPHQTRGFNVSHAGWNFTGLTLLDRTDEVKAGLVFNVAHDQTTRTQVVNWLAQEYGVSL